MKKTFWLLLLVMICPNLFAASLLSIQIKQQAGHPSVLFTLDKPVAHKIFTLTNPDRVVIDFENTNLIVNLKQVNPGSQLIKNIRSGHPNPQTLRLVFEMNQAVKTKANPLRSLDMAKHGFSLDLSANGNLSLNLKATESSSASPSKPVTKVIAPVTTSSVAHYVPNRKPRDILIVLDPGHGGKDPGARGPNHTWEKNVTLAMALKLKQIIDKQPGMRAVLTRKGDYYIGLRERLKIARKYNADVFVSIHADAFINQQSNGASVFALSQSGATSEAARWLAEKENYSELGGVNLADLDDQSGLVRTVLIDLSQTATIGASVHMGERVLSHLNNITALHNSKVEQARFMVLKSPDIPSILIETGFISNPREEKNLASPAYQTQLTQAIFQGLKRYFGDYPPHGTQIEFVTTPKTVVTPGANSTIHLVSRGDSLSKIAARYHTSIAALQAANHLTSLQVRVGQKLVIPA